MLDFRPKRPSATPRFSLNRADLVRQAGHQHRSKRGLWHGMFLTVMAGAIVWLMVDWLRVSTPIAHTVAVEVEAPPMARPLLDDRPALPSAADVANAASTVKDEIASGTPPVWVDDADPALLAWAVGITAQDQATPPLPQAVEPKDLTLRRVRPGSTVLVSGQVQDNVAAPFAAAVATSNAPEVPGLRRLIVMLAPDQYAYLYAPHDTGNVALGSDIQAVGRYAGSIHVRGQSAAGGNQTVPVEVPLIIARRVTASGSVDDGDRPFWREEGTFSVPADVYSYVEDERLMVETRPYYYLLGQVSRERSTPAVFAQAENANLTADGMHQHPADFRGKPFTIRGTVFHAWVDPQVARDRPFGVQRVVRVITWSEDWSPITIGDPPRQQTKLVLRTFEFAAITDQPVPEPGTVIQVTGRFLRMRAMEVKPDPQREAKSGYSRQSDHSYNIMFVTDAWTVIPQEPPPHWGWWNSVVLAIALLFTGWLLRLIFRAQKNEGQVQESVRKLRSVRWRNKPAPADAKPSPDPGPAAPSAPESEPG